MTVKLIKEDIDRWFDIGLYPQTRTIYLGDIAAYGEGSYSDFIEESGIYWNLSRRLIKSLHILDATSPDGEKPITIIMNSIGGCWRHGMAIYDAISHSKSYVVIINMSNARSMTSLILQSADYRIMAPHGYYLIHDGEYSEGGIPASVITNVDQEKKCLATMYEIYLSRILDRDEGGNLRIDTKEASQILHSKLPPGSEKIRIKNGELQLNARHIQQMCSRDTFFSPIEAVKLNLADRLLIQNDICGAMVNPGMLEIPIGYEGLKLEE